MACGCEGILSESGLIEQGCKLPVAKEVGPPIDGCGLPACPTEDGEYPLYMVVTKGVCEIRAVRPGAKGAI